MKKKNDDINAVVFDKINLPDGYYWDFNLEEKAKETNALYSKAWQRYYLEEGDIESEVEEDPSSEVPFKYFFWGVRDNKELIAAVSMISIPTESDFKKLPDEGWSSIQKMCKKNGTHDTISLLSAAIHPKAQGLGISKILIRQVKENLRKMGYKFLVAPIRPSLKSNYPNMSIEQYLNMESEKGEIFDPWLRVHIKLGAEKLNICPNSYCVKASLKKWEEWLGHSIPSGEKEFLPTQALNPVIIEGDIGTYIEPNVWVKHTL